MSRATQIKAKLKDTNESKIDAAIEANAKQKKGSKMIKNGKDTPSTTILNASDKYLLVAMNVPSAIVLREYEKGATRPVEIILDKSELKILKKLLA